MTIARKVRGFSRAAEYATWKLERKRKAETGCNDEFESEE